MAFCAKSRGNEMYKKNEDKDSRTRKKKTHTHTSKPKVHGKMLISHAVFTNNCGTKKTKGLCVCMRVIKTKDAP